MCLHIPYARILGGQCIEHIPVLFSNYDGNASNPVQPEEELEAVHEHRLSFKFQELLRLSCLHAGPYTTCKQDNCHIVDDLAASD